MLTELSALLDLLRAKGVASFTGPLGAGFVTLALGPIEPPAKTEKDDAPIVDTETCRCGHALYAHINGLCGESCDFEKCAPPERP